MHQNFLRPPYKAIAYPYVMISGSYKDDIENDSLCEILGTLLSELNIGIISGGNLPGRNVCSSFFRRILSANKYDPRRIITYYRFKENEPKRHVDAFGSINFIGNTPTDMRKEMISNSKALIIIGGNSGTTEEVHLATINDIPVIQLQGQGDMPA